MRLVFAVFFFSCLILCFLIAGFYKISPIKLLSDAKELLIEKKNVALNVLQACEVEITSEVFRGSQVFIGHAYGDPNTAKLSDFISSNAEKFMHNYSSLVSRIVFTGDVFSVPSHDKWKRLRSFASDNVDIIISPGNHDFLRPDSRDVFKQSEFASRPYPFEIEVDGASLIIENSIETYWKPSAQAINIANSAKHDLIIIARHNAPIKELSELVNSKNGMAEDLKTVEELSNDFDNYKSYIWIIGDSGAFAHMPRISCLTYKNHKFIMNGLGQTNGDSVLLYHDKNIFEYKL